jgi:hypothetical protein
LAEICDDLTSPLELFSGEESIGLRECKGVSLWNSKDTFLGQIDPALGSTPYNLTRMFAVATQVQVYTTVKPATLEQMFRSEEAGHGAFQLAQEHVVDFAQRHLQWLVREEGAPHFFLCQAGSIYFVACVFFGKGFKLSVTKYNLDDPKKWSAENRRIRVILPTSPIRPPTLYKM